MTAGRWSKVVDRSAAVVKRCMAFWASAATHRRRKRMAARRRRMIARSSHRLLKPDAQQGVQDIAVADEPAPVNAVVVLGVADHGQIV